LQQIFSVLYLKISFIIISTFTTARCFVKL